MGSKFLAHLRRQWMGALALFLVLTGGTAMALPGINTVFSDDIVNGEVKTADISDTDGVRTADVRNDNLSGGGLTAADLRSGAVGNTEIADGGVRSPDVQNEALTGADIANQSGVDTCVQTTRIGQLCVRAENDHRPWGEAFEHCANLDLRLPSLGEAMELARTHDIPNVDENETFWTGDRYWIGDVPRADIVGDNGGSGFSATDAATEQETVCVTTPTN